MLKWWTAVNKNIFMKKRKKKKKLKVCWTSTSVFNFIETTRKPLRSENIIWCSKGSWMYSCLQQEANFQILWDFCRSRVSSGSIVSDYGLDNGAIGARSPAEAKDFSSNLCVQTSSGAHPASCPMGTGGPLSGGSLSGGKSAAGAWHWPLTPT
jgi:hypothetical protein